MEPVVNTTRYLIAGYAVILGAMLAYAVSLWLRWRRLCAEERDLPGSEDQPGSSSSQ